MKNVTVSLDDETYRRARVRAASVGRSLSSIVRESLENFGTEETKLEARRRELRALYAKMDAEGVGLRASENIPRDQLYDERFNR